jgi:hypothetical protein
MSDASAVLSGLPSDLADSSLFFQTWKGGSFVTGTGGLTGLNMLLC